MRTGLIALGLLAAASAWAASAQDAQDPAQSDYQAELARQCPDKQLQLLSARNLSDGLDDYKQSLPDDLRGRFDKAESDQCSSLDAGAACTNNADIEVADQIGRIGELAGSVCASFLRCRDQNDCDYAR